jgi:hypothetical protein
MAAGATPVPDAERANAYTASMLQADWISQNLQPQQWLAPSMVSWDAWELLLDGNVGTPE